jgi:hypothetical protein
MCKASLLQNTDALSTFHIEKPNALHSLSNMKKQRKKKVMQRLWTENKHYGLQSHKSHGAKR